MRPTVVNKTSHKFTGKLGQKVDKTKCGHIYKIILSMTSINFLYLSLGPSMKCMRVNLPPHQQSLGDVNLLGQMMWASAGRVFSRESDSRIANVRLSIIKTPWPPRIMPIYHNADK